MNELEFNGDTLKQLKEQRKQLDKDISAIENAMRGDLAEKYVGKYFKCDNTFGYIESVNNKSSFNVKSFDVDDSGITMDKYDTVYSNYLSFQVISKEEFDKQLAIAVEYFIDTFNEDDD